METKRRLSTGGMPKPASSESTALSSKDDYSKMLAQIAKVEESATISVHSVATARKQQAKDEKDVEKIGYDGDRAIDIKDIDKWVQNRCISWACRKGKKPDLHTPNQDSFSILNVEGQFALYGVYDGHGPQGHEISDYVREHLIQLILEDRSSCDDERWDAEKGLHKSFIACQKHIKEDKALATKALSSGTTVTVAYHDFPSNVVTIAWVGDSRAVLHSADELIETEDHKPDNPKEKKRIEASGGRVVFDGYYNHRVFAKAGMYPGLNMSRSLGDTTGHDQAGLTAEPEVMIKKLDQDVPMMLLLCTDGVWEFIESKQAADQIAKDLSNDKGKVEKALVSLADASYQFWMKDSHDEISDDITGILVTL